MPWCHLSSRMFVLYFSCKVECTMHLRVNYVEEEMPLERTFQGRQLPLFPNCVLRRTWVTAAPTSHLSYLCACQVLKAG